MTKKHWEGVMRLLRVPNQQEISRGLFFTFIFQSFLGPGHFLMSTKDREDIQAGNKILKSQVNVL